MKIILLSVLHHIVTQASSHDPGGGRHYAAAVGLDAVRPVTVGLPQQLIAFGRIFTTAPQRGGEGCVQLFFIQNVLPQASRPEAVMRICEGVGGIV